MRALCIFRVIEIAVNVNNQDGPKQMPDDKNIKRALEKALRLRQSDEVWEGTGRIARTWISPKNKPPYRPYVVMFASGEKGILRCELIDRPPTPERMFEELLNAMRRPFFGSGFARRPSVVYLDNAEFVAVLSPWLAELNISCKYRRVLPMLENALYEVFKGMNKREPLPGLLSIPDVTPPVVEHLYQLAAAYYRLAPWQWLSDMNPIEIRYPSDGQSRYAVVMGSGGEVFGLSVYDTLDDLRGVYMHLPLQQRYESCTWFAFYFDEAMAMTFEDLEAKDKYGWPIAGEQAYPIFARTTRNGELTIPDNRDIFWAEGALAAILAYFEKHEKDYRRVSRPAKATLTISTISRDEQVYLRIPAIREDKLFQLMVE
jgi:hypothetical protein